MVQAIEVTLIECLDNSVKQIIMHLDNKMHFIIEDLDERYVAIDSSQVDAVQAAVYKILAENSYTKAEDEL